MDVRKAGNSELIVNGVIKTINDCITLRSEIEKLHEAGAFEITLRIEESFALPSAIIGYLMKLVNRDRVTLTLLAKDLRLCVLLEELQLTKAFGVRYIGG